jgi:hypothetical protein
VEGRSQVAIFGYFGVVQPSRVAIWPWGGAPSPDLEAKKLLHPEVPKKSVDARANLTNPEKQDQNSDDAPRTHTHKHTHMHIHSRTNTHPRTHAPTRRLHEHSHARTRTHAHAHAHADAVNKENEGECSDQCALTLAGRGRAALRAAYESVAIRRSLSATSSSRSANEHDEQCAQRERYNIYRNIVR